MRDNILLTGVGGVLGGLLLQSLSKENINIKAISSNYEHLKKNYKKKNISFFDYTEFYKNNIDFSNISTIIHFAFARNLQGSELSKSMHFSQELFSAACKNNVEKIINISSQGIYGNYREKNSSENDIVNPHDMYSLAKYSCEQMANILCKDSNTAISHIRLSSVLSPFFKERLVNKMIVHALKNKEIIITGGQQVFSFLDARDAVSGISKLISFKLDSDKSIYNLGPYTSHSILEIATVIQKVMRTETGKDIKIILNKQDIKMKLCLDSTKFYKELSWMPKYTLEDTIKWILTNKLCDKENI